MTESSNSEQPSKITPDLQERINKFLDGTKQLAKEYRVDMRPVLIQTESKIEAAFKVFDDYERTDA